MESKERVNILLVDDQPSRLLTYEAILNGLGQNLVQAHSGTEALERLMEREFAVILLDVSMPGMDGFETASLIHEHPRFEKTPIIFVTGVNVTDPDRLKGYKLGAVDYVYIPVVPEILRSKVAVLVELHCKRRELEIANSDLSAANSTLQAEKTRELELLNTTLEVANDNLARTNRALEAEIVERRRAEEALKEADRRKDEFLATLAHELRNPLAPVRNAIEIMLRLPQDDPKLVWSRDVIRRQVVHLTRLVNDLLDVSRITLGKIELQRESIDLVALITNAVEAQRPSIDARSQIMTIGFPNVPLFVNGDPVRLAQVVANLLENAVKYTHEGGQIWLTLEAAVPGADGSREAIIRVKDSGVGMPAELLARIFEPFVQAKQKLEHSQGGLGIGLALVRRLVELHEGRVSAHSEGEGMGSEIVVRLPALASEPLASSAQEHPGTNGQRPKSDLRILVVDDNFDAAKSLSLLLQLSGNEVHMASDGLEAVAAVESLRPDVVLLDIGMPNIDGYEAARRIRRLSGGDAVVLVALTGYNQELDRRKSEDAGFDAHMTKPADLATLMDLMQQLNRKRAAAECGGLRETEAVRDHVAHCPDEPS
jgi:signal transduction histidine kinase